MDVIATMYQYFNKFLSFSFFFIVFRCFMFVYVDQLGLVLLLFCCFYVLFWFVLFFCVFVFIVGNHVLYDW